MTVTGLSSVGLVENQSIMEQLCSPDSQVCLEAVKYLKGLVIGSNRQKSRVVGLGALPRFVQILNDPASAPALLIETSVTLGSIAKGSDDHVKAVIDCGAIDVLLRGVFHSDLKYVECCLRCLRTVLSNRQAPIEYLYASEEVVPRLIVLCGSSTPAVAESVVKILAAICKTPAQQCTLCSLGAVEAVSAVLLSRIRTVQMEGLKCLASFCFQNEEVSKVIAATECGGKCVPDILGWLMARDRSPEMQLASAKVVTYVYRAGALASDDPRVVFKALPTLVRMCQKDIAIDLRIEGAETLAYLTESDIELQKIASISNHLIPTLSDLLRCPVHGKPNTLPDPEKLATQTCKSPAMKRAAFKAFSSLASNEEEIRKRIIENAMVMDEIVWSLSDEHDDLRLAALSCLHSLSRSVLQLRTTFQDHTVWRPLVRILKHATDDVLTVASSTLCNLLLEFSPSKEAIIECGTIELLCNFTRRDDPALRLNGVWALMNMAFQADLKVKTNILSALGSDEIFRLLTDSDVGVLMKTLGLLRNLLTSKPHIDHIMGLLGKRVMQALILILEGDSDPEVKEQALCVLANIADGDFAKNFIMSNEDVLKKLTTYMTHPSVKLQTAATFCICNLIWKDDEGSAERQAKLKELGVQQLLQQLIATTDTTLFDKVKTALLQFPPDVPQ